MYTEVHLEGKGGATKTDEFSENSKQPLTPPPSFWENYIAIFFIMDMVAYIQGGMRAR